MPRRTKNSFPSLSEVDVQKFVLELPGTNEAQDAAVVQDTQIQRTDLKKHERKLSD